MWFWKSLLENDSVRLDSLKQCLMCIILNYNLILNTWDGKLLRIMALNFSCFTDGTKMLLITSLSLL